MKGCKHKWVRISFGDLEEFLIDRIFEELAREEYKGVFPIRKRMTSQELFRVADIVATLVLSDLERLVE